MNVDQEERLDLSGVFKNEADLISERRKRQTQNNEDDDIFDEFETKTPGAGHNVEIKQEIIECEEPKIEHSSDFLSNEGTSEYIQPKVEQHSDFLPNEDSSEYIQPKVEVLTTHCYLPILKNENIEYPDYLTESCDREQDERASNMLNNNSSVLNVERKKQGKFLIISKLNNHVQ